jgi:hypothetical protein
MQRLVAAPERPDPRKARAHIERYSMPAFVERVGRLADHLSAAD